MTITYQTGTEDRSTQTGGAPASGANETVTSPSLLLTSEQAAEYLQVSLRTIKNLMSHGQLAYIKVGRATRVQRSDIDDYIARNRRKQRNGLRAS